MHRVCSTRPAAQSSVRRKTSNNGAAYTYDAENRIVSAGGGTYLYDGDGQRMGRVFSSYSNLYWHDVNGNVLLEDSASGVNLREYVFFGGQRIARRDVSSNTVHYIFSDHLGTTSLITDANGDMASCSGYTSGQFESDYYPFGGEIPICASLSDQNYKFTGQERDAETGNDYFGARHYTSAMGRFMTPDPSGLSAQEPEYPQSWNLYTYVLNNPLVAVDPDGLDCVYLNDNGDRVQSIDHDSNADECSGNNNGGYWIPGTVMDSSWVYGIDQDNNEIGAYSVLGDGMLGFTASTADFGGAWQTVGVDAPDSGAANNVDTMSPTAQAQLVAIHDALAKIPVPCGATGSASIGKEGKDIGVTVNSSKSSMLNVQGNAPVPQPPVVFELALFKVGFQVYGTDWHHVTGVGLTGTPFDVGGLKGRVNLGSMDACAKQ